MSFSDFSGKSNSVVIYKAVVPGSDDSNTRSNDLTECLLPPEASSGRSSNNRNSSSGNKRTPNPKCSAFLMLMSGFCFGSLGWSSTTALTAYSVLAMILLYSGGGSGEDAVDEPLPKESETKMEYNLALAAFTGFCATCTFLDAARGTPVTIVLLKAGVAAFWGLLMSIALRKIFAMDTTMEEQHKGTKLPMLAFVV